MPTLLVCVTGLHGPDDERRVEDALRAEPGVFGAVASCQDGCAEVDYEDDETTIDRILAVIRGTGFEASLGG